MRSYLPMQRPAQRRSEASADGRATSALGDALNRSPAVQSQFALQRMLNQHPAVVAQAKLAEALSGRPLQREAADEDDLLQSKSNVQRQTESDEDDILQSKFSVAQRQNDLEDEDIAQAKSAPVQREAMTDEDELLQGKFSPVQRQADALEDEDLMQTQSAAQTKSIAQREAMADEDDLLQGKFASGAAQAEPVQRREANRTGMPDQLKTGVEQLSGIAMDDVRVHYNSSQPAQLEALAYAQGADIHVGPGQEQHLAHEAWHVAQQKQGRVQPTLQTKGVSINDDAGLEREADRMGAKAASGIFSSPAGGGAAQRKLGAGRIIQNKTVQAKTIQQRPYARDANGQRVDLGAAHWTPATLQALLDSLPYQMADRYQRRINGEIARRGGAPAGAALVAAAPAPVAAPIAAAGNAVISSANAMRHGIAGLLSSGSERQPIIADTERDEAAAKSAGQSAVTTLVGGAVSVATGGISSYVRAGGAAGAQAVRAAQIDGLLTEAENAARDSHSSVESAAAAPAGLADALRTVRNCLLAQAGGEAAAGVIPFAGTVVNAAVGDDLRAASDVIWANAGNNDLARRAAEILGINQGSSSSKYGSNDTGGGGGGGAGGGGGGAPSS